MSTTSQEVEHGSLAGSIATMCSIDTPEETIEFYNNVPHFNEGYKFNDKFEICERVGWDDRIGATYFVKPLDESKPFELVMRIDKFTDKNSILPMENMVLSEANRAGKHQLFGQIYESGIFLDDYGYYCSYFRGGPSLRQICDFMRENRADGVKFTASTVGRFAENLFEIVGFLHSKDLILCGLNQEMFHFDGASRTLFLSDLSSIRREPTKQLANIAVWSGSLEYTSVNWTEKEMIKRNMELEAIFYMVLEFALGALPWGALNHEKCKSKMQEFNESDVPAELESLPRAYQTLWEMVKAISKSEKPYESLAPILKQCVIIYKEVGGCQDLDEDLDFERQPREEELPKFVMEKTPIVVDEPAADESAE